MTPEPSIPEKGLELALAILEHVARCRDGVTASELVKRVGAPRASVYRAVGTLTREGYLVRRPDLTGFLLGRRVLELASIVEAHRRSPVDPIVDDLRRATGEAVHLFAFTDDGMELVAEDASIPIADSDALFRNPESSAAGHLWLASHDGPGGWPEVPSAPVREQVVAAVSVRGHAEQFGSVLPAVGCIAVPVMTNGREIGALALATGLGRVSTAARHLVLLREGAAAIGAVLDA